MSENQNAITISAARWSPPQLTSALQAEIYLADGAYVYCPALTDDLVPEAERILAAYRDSLQPARSRDISAMIGTAALAYPAPTRFGDIEAKARVRLFVDLLSDLPRDSLAHAFREWVCNNRFFPTPAEIRALAEDFLKPRFKMIRSLNNLLSKTRLEHRTPDGRRSETTRGC